MNIFNNDGRFIASSELTAEEVAVGVQRTILAYDDATMLVKVTFETGSIGELHHHVHTQISYVEKGIFEVEINGKTQELNAGSSFYVSPNIPHGVRCLEKGILIDVFSPMREDFINK